MATLTAGPVAPGDAVGLTNASLIMKSCMTDGTLLRPTVPAIPINEYFLQKCESPGIALRNSYLIMNILRVLRLICLCVSLALGQGGPQGELYTAESWIAKETYGTLIAIDMKVSVVVSTCLQRRSIAPFLTFFECLRPRLRCLGQCGAIRKGGRAQSHVLSFLGITQMPSGCFLKSRLSQFLSADKQIST